MFGTIEFIDLGRNKFNGTLEVKNEDHFWKEIKKHVMSRDLEYHYDCDTNEGAVLAGFRCIGRFKLRLPEKRMEEG